MALPRKREEGISKRTANKLLVKFAQFKSNPIKKVKREEDKQPTPASQLKTEDMSSKESTPKPDLDTTTNSSTTAGEENGLEQFRR